MDVDCFVYFIRADDDGPIKIGISKNVEKRLVNMQTGNPQRLIVEKVFGPFTEADARKYESSFHSLFRHHRINGGEWFRRTMFMDWHISQLEIDKKGRLVEPCPIERLMGIYGETLNEPINKILNVARSAHKSGDTEAYKYIQAEVEELLNDLKTGRL